MLYPIRIDASSDDQSARLIDSILIDPSCLPISPSSALNLSNYRTTNTKDDTAPNRKRKRMTPLETTIHQNSSYLASSLLADMEVFGTSRNHKTTRLRLLTKCPGLKERVEGQIRQQLRVVLRREEDNIGRVVDASAISASPAATVKREEDDKECKEADVNLVKIKIRLHENGISVVDEFSVDPHLPSSNPIVLAQSIVSDMNLPLEMVNSIAISISEQILGLEVGGSLDGMMCDDNLNVQGGGPYWPAGRGKVAATIRKQEVRREIPTAWVMNDTEDDLARAYYLKNLKLKGLPQPGKIKDTST